MIRYKAKCYICYYFFFYIPLLTIKNKYNMTMILYTTTKITGIGLATKSSTGAGVVIGSKNTLSRFNYTLLTTKRTFSLTRPLKADPFTTATVGATFIIGRSLVNAIALAIGLSSLVFGLIFSPLAATLPITFPVDVAYEYLDVMDDLDRFIGTNIHTFNGDQLREILRGYEGIIRIHEEVFNIATPLLNELEGTLAFDAYNFVFQT